MNEKTNETVPNNGSVANRPLLWQEPTHGWRAYHPDHAEAFLPSLDGPGEERIEDLCNYLLSIDGLSVEVPDSWDGDLCQDILEDGQFFSTDDIIAGGRKDCCSYHNCRNLWLNNKDKYRIVDGFALNNGEWTPHLWVVTFNNEIVDTTPKERYFGLILTDYAADVLCGDDELCE